ncbi:MAG: tryptophan-rich sensory protein [Chloracidobacterium sp.]|nr:tryptophan-rich sensory protein [Chloracidobacterium sp.]
MQTAPNTRDRMRAILLIVATIGTIVFNGLAATGYVNGVTPEVISAKYPTVLTPAGYAFSIWSLIYLGIIAFSIYQVLPRNIVRFRPVRSLYIATCVFNCAWIYFWHRDQIGICLVLIAGLLLTLIGMLILLRRAGGNPLLTTAPFGIYAGWVTAATLVNFTIFLKYIGAEISPTAWNTLGVAILVIAAALAFVIRWRLQNYIYPLAVAWAATAIAVKQSGNTAIVVAAAFCTVTCLVVAGSVVTSLKDSTSE